MFTDIYLHPVSIGIFFLVIKLAKFRYMKKNPTLAVLSCGMVNIDFLAEFDYAVFYFLFNQPINHRTNVVNQRLA